jgi:hypothetical protein
MIVENGGPGVDLKEAVFFPFDARSVQLRYLLQPGLVPGVNPWLLHNHVLESGGPEAPDHLNLRFYGTVIRIGDELRMWYIGWGDDGGDVGYRICYAVSRDGINWEKPELGLTPFNGNRKNNLVRFDSEHRSAINAILVLHDPEDPDPERHFKMINEVHPFLNIASYSPDGLHWREAPGNPICKHNGVEPGGLMKFNGCYYLNGQGGNVGSKRALVTYMSYDFEHWTDAVAVGLRRDVPPYKQIAGPHAGEQAHLGAALWNRGNVVIGFYGQWHGESNDRAHVSMDLGLAVSNDGLQFVEPVPDFKIIDAYEVDCRTAAVPLPCLEQGQGFENIGDETLVWYAPWRGGFICVARWERDRLGYFQVVPDPKPRQLMAEDTHSLFWREHVGDMVPEKTNPHFITCPIRLQGAEARVFVNADGLSTSARLRVEALDVQFRPLAGYAGDACVPLAESGLRQAVRWQANERLAGLDDPLRLKVTWEGDRWDDAFFYGAYIEQGE